MATFRGIDFDEAGANGDTFPAWSGEPLIDVKHIPGGSRNVVQVGGMGADTVSMDIECSRAALDSLRAARLLSGSLVFSFETRTAVLQSVTNVQERSDGMYLAQLTFIGL